jgi:cytochrome P450
VTATQTFPFPETTGIAPSDIYREIGGPVSRVALADGRGAWLVTGYDEVRTVLADPRFSRAAAMAEGVGAPGASDTPVTSPGNLLAFDGTAHNRLRRPVVAVFTPRRVDALRPEIGRIAATLIDDIRAGGDAFDLVSRYAFPIPLQVICQLLGVPFADREVFGGWADAFLSTTAYSLEQRAEAAASMAGYLQELVERRRTEPSSDLISGLLQVPQADRLLDEEITGLASGILVAGHETTANQISNMIYLALTRPEVAAGLRGSPEQVRAMVEELLRWIALASTVGFPRVATSDMTLGSEHVRAGDIVLPEMFAANRDSRAFLDPDDINPHRPARPHLAFGHGIHHCLGAALARAELQIAVPALLHAFPALRPAEPLDGLSWRTGQLVRGPRRLLLASG